MRASATGNTADSHPLGYIDGVGAGAGPDRACQGELRQPVFHRQVFCAMDAGPCAVRADGTVSQREEERRQREQALPGGRPPVDSDEHFDADIKLLALYAQDEWDITPRWSAYAGLRWEGIDTRSAGDSFDAWRQRSSVWSPLLQTLWKLPDTKGDQVRLALTRTYKSPSTSNLDSAPQHCDEQ